MSDEEQVESESEDPKAADAAQVVRMTQSFEFARAVLGTPQMPAWLGWLALRGMPEAARPRFVTTVHGLNSPSRYSAIMARGERVVCVSQSVRAHVLRHYPATDPRCLRVIPRGIDPAAFALKASRLR